jgi:hypothetical protein
MKTPDKNMRSIPKIRGNIPVPAIRKVPIGILRERTAVTAPKRKMTIPTIISSLSKNHSFLTMNGELWTMNEER